MPPKADSTNAPTELDSASVEFFRDPHAILAEVRGRGRVEPDALGGSMLLARHQDATELLKSHAHSKDPRKLPEGHVIRDVHERSSPGRAPSFVFLDPPEHTRLRRLVSMAFTPRAIEERRPRIEEITEALLDRIGDRPTFELVEELAQPLPILVIAEMLGVETSDHARFTRWSLDVVHRLNPYAAPEVRDRALAAQEALRGYFAGIVDERRARPADDLLSRLSMVDADGDCLDSGELVDLAILLLVGGNVTTTDALGNGVLALLTHPAELQRLREQPALLPVAVEEILRFDPSVTAARRFVIADAEVAGCPMKRGTYVSASLTSANRDPAVFRDPDTFDVARAPNPHVTFGAGIHYCLGAPLARAELQIALGCLLRRYATMELAVAVEELRWKEVVFFRGPAALPIRVAP